MLSLNSARASRVFASVVLAVGLVLSLAAFFLVQQWEHAIIRADFRLFARNHVAAIQRELDRHLESVEGAAGLYAASHDVDRDEFREYARRALASHADIQAFMWAPRIAHAQRPAFESQARHDGLAGYSIMDAGPQGTGVIAGPRAEYYPVYFVVPLAGNETLPGHDAVANPAWVSALSEARDVVAPVMAPVVQGPGGHYRTSLFQAIYRNGTPLETVAQRRENLAGYIIETIRVGDMVEEALRGTAPSGLDFRLYEYSAGGDRRLLYFHSSRTRNGAGIPAGAAGPEYSWEAELHLPGSRWSASFSPSPAFLAGHSVWRSWSVLAGSLLVTAALGGVLLLQARHAARREGLTRRLTEANERLRREIGQRRKAEETLTQSEAQHRLLFETMAQGVIYLDKQGVIITANSAAERILGVCADDARGHTCASLGWKTIHEDGSVFPSEGYPSAVALQTGGPVTDVVMGVHNPQENGYRWILVSAIPQFKDGEHAPHQVYVTFNDITERVEADARMRKLSRALEQAADAVTITDARGVVEYVNPAFETITGYSAADVLGKTAAVLKSGRHDTAFYRRLWDTIKRGDVFHDVMINRKKDGTLYYEEKTITPLKNINGVVTHYISTGKDNTERMQTEDRLHYLAYHDVLTGLPNRALFMERLEHSLKQRAGHERKAAVLFLDLDNFKIINDTLGHDAGDTLLQALAQRLVACVRVGDTLARFGGDDFSILLEEVRDSHDVTFVVHHVLAVLDEPFMLGEREVYVTASIGASLFPLDGEDAGTLLKHADTAMFRAKDRGRNSFEFYAADLSEGALKRLTLETQLRHAIENQEFELHYQPQVKIAGGAVFGVEALIRWRHPTMGLISPLDFIPILEDTGLIVPVGDWVLRTACAQAQFWEREGMASVRMSVNVSGKQFQDPRFCDVVGEIIRESGILPAQLELEITESVLMQDDHASLQNMRALRGLGLRLSIDDFGTGYSSLSYLKRFPVDTLKIDRSFVRDITSDPDDAQIIRAIVAMAHGLRLSVVAEGVETDEQREFLRHIACDAMQGYLFSRPLPAADITELLRADVPRRTAL